MQNPASRLLSILQKLAAIQSSGVTEEVLRETLGAQVPFTSCLNLLIDIRSEYDSLEKSVGNIEESNPKYQLLTDQLPTIQKSIDSLSISWGPRGGLGGGFGGNGNKDVQLSWSISEPAILSLRFMVHEIPVDSVATEDDLKNVREHAEELRIAIQSCEDLDQELKVWLLELVRVIRDAIDTYAIRGSQGIREKFCHALGEVILSRQHWDSLQRKDPSIVERIKAVFGALNFIATAVRNVDYLSDVHQKAVEVISDYQAG